MPQFSYTLPDGLLNLCVLGILCLSCSNRTVDREPSGSVLLETNTDGAVQEEQERRGEGEGERGEERTAVVFIQPHSTKNLFTFYRIEKKRPRAMTRSWQKNNRTSLRQAFSGNVSCMYGCVREFNVSVAARASIRARDPSLTANRPIPDVEQCEAAGQFQRWSGIRLRKQSYTASYSGRSIRTNEHKVHPHITQ